MYFYILLDVSFMSCIYPFNLGGEFLDCTLYLNLLIFNRQDSCIQFFLLFLQICYKNLANTGM